MSVRRLVGIVTGSTSSLRLVKNSVWNTLAFAVSLAANVAVVPIVVRQLGMGEFGLAGLLLSLLVPLQLVGAVLGQATVRELSVLVTHSDYNAARRMLASILAVCIAACVAVFVVFVAVLSVSKTRLSASAGWGAELRLAILLAAAGWVAQQLNLVLQSVLSALQQYQYLAAASVSASIVSAVAIVACTIAHPTPAGYLCGVSLGFALATLLWLGVLTRTCPFRLPLPAFHASELRSVLGFARWQSVVQLAGAVSNQMDRYVLGAFAASSAVGQYNVAMRVQEVAYMGALKSVDVLYPHFSATMHQPIEGRARLFLVASWAANILSACALAPLIALAPPLISLWIGAEDTADIARMLQTLAVAGLVGSAVNVYVYHSMGTGKSARLAALTIAGAVVTTLASVAFVVRLGPRGAGLGILTSSTVQVVLALFVTRSDFAPMLTLFRLIWLTWPPILVGLAVGFGCLQGRWFVPVSWTGLLVDYFSVALLTLGVSVAIAMTSGYWRYAIGQARAASGSSDTRGS